MDDPMSFETITAPQHTIPTMLLAGVGAVLFLITAGVLGYQYMLEQGRYVAVDYTPLYEVHDEAAALAAAGRTEDAQLVLETFLNENEDPVMEEFTELSMARNLRASDMAGAVAQYKGIVANTNHSNETRARAAEEMALIYMLALAPDDAAYTATVFAQEPYAALQTEATDIEGAYVKLFEYANTFSPRLLGTSFIAVYESGFVPVAVEPMRTKLAAFDELLLAAPDTDEQKPLALTLRAITSLRLGTVQGFESERSKVIPLWEQAMDTSEFFVASLRTALEAKGLRDQFDYNYSYFGKGYLFEVFFTELARIPEAHPTLRDAVIHEYLAYLTSESGAAELARLHTARPSALVALTILAETNAELRAFLEASGIIAMTSTE